MLILQVTPFEAVVGDANGPPAIPQPYLDADKTIVVPSNKDVQEVFALRNEWLTQEKTHMAAERVRVLNQMALFIVWSWALKYVGSITIYENDGLCWNNGNIVQCKERIRNFLRNEFNFFFFSNVSKSIPNTLPKVTIIDCITGETYLNFDDTDLNIQGPSLCSTDELLQEYTINELKVYLQDERIRLKHIGIDEQPPLNWYSFLPPFPKLTIVPTTEFLKGGPLTTCEPGLPETSVAYRRNEQFNFKMFLNVLSYYNRSQGKESSISIEEESHHYSTSYN
ncbi:uncharacterized protein KQ657_000873 [Scheffersomyces spartinae]|uniref:Uncharacterized protein n=1 Tax=Scheffersomyces spartinae TaxID=45513 RepID=A0A9P8AIA8_9ASCO|nr:uncharacterized protein KQ657_000873 [Scheffersomyces spartinae]KAG7193454.1 hypothetical protein KQ657_000873 [Scheffersomyces spartinae]